MSCPQSRQTADMSKTCPAKRVVEIQYVHPYPQIVTRVSNLRVDSPGRRAADMFEIGRPDLNWKLFAKGTGVLGTRVNSIG